MPVDTERFVVRAYRAGDEQSILDLFARSFHPPRTSAQWRWKFQQSPYGRERISLTFDEERLVGHYAGYPVPFVAAGHSFLAHQIGDTMTDPSVRHIGRGPTSILGRTALHFYENFCEGQVAFNYGFNVANIQKFSLRFLRSDRVEPVGYRMRDLRQQPMKRLGRVERWARGITLGVVTEASSEWNELFARVAPHYGFLSRRDAGYVQWRYLQAPEVDSTVVAMRRWGRLAGWLVFRLREGRLTVGDLLLDPDHADVLEAALRHLAGVVPAGVIDLWCPPRPGWLDRFLHDLGFASPGEPQGLSLMCVPFMQAGAVTLMREALYYTMGDSDLF
ncbi:MAG TPA: GNAT family N-acetyltransferase [Thermoanaerobaculia bacterium]|nr:GNAT family N-acetyltransferase [Thermoanaerobaculia bacterium]